MSEPLTDVEVIELQLEYDREREEREQWIIDLIDIRDNRAQTVLGSHRWHELNNMIRGLKATAIGPTPEVEKQLSDAREQSRNPQ